MANQTSDNNNNKFFNLNSSSSSQTKENINIPGTNVVNQNFDNAPNLSQGFNNKNYSMSDLNNKINKNYNPALGQRQNNRNSDLAKPILDDKDDNKSVKKDNNDSNSDHSDNELLNDKHSPGKTDSNSSMLRHTDSNNTNNTNNLHRFNNINNESASDNDAESGKFHKKSITNNNSELGKQATNNNFSDTDDDKNNTINTRPSLLNNIYFLNPVIRKRIIISGSIIVGLIIAIIIFISVLNALVVVMSASMCDNRSQSSYSGSGDVLEFMCGMQSPVKDYTVTSKFGYNVDSVHAGRLHSGIDLAVSTGTPVYAAQSGTVVGIDTTGSDMSTGYGHDVVIDHGGGIFTRYGHNSKLLVSKGDIVAQGQQIAEAGSTGHSTGPHGHFEIMKTTLADLFSGHQDPNDYFVNNANFMMSCGSSAIINTVNSTDSTTSTTTLTTTQKSYSSLKILKTLSNSTGKTKSINMNGKNPQSFAYNNNYYYVQWISPGASGKDGYIHKYDSNISFKSSSTTSQAVGHGNGLTYSTSDNQLYSVTVSGIRDNTNATIIDPNTLKVVGTKKLGHGTSAIAYDRLTNRFITSSGASNGSSSSTGYLYVYNSSLSKQVGAKSIAKKRWKTPGDIAAYGGIIYVCIHESVGKNYIDMYNEDTGDYLGSYSAPYSEIEGIDINDNGEIVLLFHSSDFIQFTGIKANVINSSSGDNTTNLSNNQCCLDGSSSNTTYSSNSSEYCPNGITVTGDYAGTYELDDYVERVVTAENGGAHPEALKALAIAARTYALNRTNNCNKSIENSTSAQVMAKEASDRVKKALANVKGSVMLYNGNYFSAQYSSFYGECDGAQCTSTFIKTPSEEKGTFTMPYAYLTTAANAGHEYGLSQNGSHYMATVQGKTFDEILKFFYADGIQITGVSSSGNSCSLGGSGTYKNGKIWDYNQADYSNAYCGGTIADSGCGPTAMAMVVSTLLNEKHDPTELAKASKVCSTDKHTYFTEAAEKYGLKAVTTKDHEEVMTALNRGDSLVIANVTNATIDGLNNFWTEGGHYVVLAGHDGRDVWVQDPNKSITSTHRSNTKGDGVYNFDKYIKPAATIGYIIIKKA